MTTSYPDAEELPFKDVADHGDDVDALPDPHSFTEDDDHDRR